MAHFFPFAQPSAASEAVGPAISEWSDTANPGSPSSGTGNQGPDGSDQSSASAPTGPSPDMNDDPSPAPVEPQSSGHSAPPVQSLNGGPATLDQLYALVLAMSTRLQHLETAMFNTAQAPMGSGSSTPPHTPGPSPAVVGPSNPEPPAASADLPQQNSAGTTSSSLGTAVPHATGPQAPVPTAAQLAVTPSPPSGPPAPGPGPQMAGTGQTLDPSLTSGQTVSPPLPVATGPLPAPAALPSLRITRRGKAKYGLQATIKIPTRGLSRSEKIVVEHAGAGVVTFRTKSILCSILPKIHGSAAPDFRFPATVLLEDGITEVALTATGSVDAYSILRNAAAEEADAAALRQAIHLNSQQTAPWKGGHQSNAPRKSPPQGQPRRNQRPKTGPWKGSHREDDDWSASRSIHERFDQVMDYIDDVSQRIRHLERRDSYSSSSGGSYDRYRRGSSRGSGRGGGRHRYD